MICVHTYLVDSEGALHSSSPPPKRVAAQMKEYRCGIWRSEETRLEGSSAENVGFYGHETAKITTPRERDAGSSSQRGVWSCMHRLHLQERNRECL
mmetsp:Transcript_4250/g.9567  ORF Transcript_4250/g.9567 Transcript_4250/m.9567 type:complete len:96 (-) Transcript_4250:387-674(-)